MATKFYLHREGVGTLPSGTLPSAEQSSLTPDANLFDNEDGSENRVMNTTISAQAQTSATNTSTADTNAHNYYIMRWVSPKINQTSIAANTWTMEFAASESNANANFPRNGAGAMRVCCYVWKPSNGTKYGNILDGNTNADGEEAGTTQTVINFTFSGASVGSLTANDAVIVIELWAIVTQGNATARTQTVFYDGTTENSTSNEAAFLSTPENLTLGGTDYTTSISTQTVSVSENLARQLNATRSQSTETTNISENIVKSKGQTRELSESAIVVGESLARKLDAIRNPQETTSIGETLTRMLAATRLIPTENTTVGGGTIQTVLGYVRNMATETVTIGENLTRKLDAIRTLPETTIVEDILNRTLAATRAIATESIVIGENLVRLLAAQRIIGQTVTISDLLETLFQSGGGGNQNYTRTITEDTSISDLLERMLSAFRISNDTTVVGESINRTYSATRPISEDVPITDSLTRMLSAFRTVLESTTISDLLEYIHTPVGATNYVRDLIENVSISDTVKTLLSPIKIFKSSIGDFASEGIRTVRKGRILSPNRWRNSFYTYTHTRDPDHSEKTG